MLYLLAEYFIQKYSFLNSFTHISFRCCGALFTAFFICMLLIPKMIKYCQYKQNFYQPIRKDGPESHIANKQKVPSMGGIVIILSLIISVILWGELQNFYLWLLMSVATIFAMIGFYDDYKKVVQINVKGISAKKKFLLQMICGISCIAWVYLYNPTAYSSNITLPFLKTAAMDLGWFYFIFAAIVIVGSSNAVNLTDGLDGLAIGPILIISVVFALISYIAGNVNFSEYSRICHVAEISEIAVYCASIIGAGMGFLWFNSYPAKIFMGDTGSLSLGAVIGVISIVIKQEFILFIAGFIFVIEAVSVILQVGSYKLCQKRIFKMAPIHHHFEKVGWSESTIVIRFWILSLLLAIIALMSLKIK